MRGVKFTKEGQRLSIQVKKDGQNTRQKVGELGILCQEQEPGVDSVAMLKSYIHKSERLLFWGARTAGTEELWTLLR